jgi:hypothetical protein
MRALNMILPAVFLAAAAACASPADQRLSRESIYSLFNKANEAFRQANTASDPGTAGRLRERSILLFERIINDGAVRNPKLYYNLANTYLLNGDVGRAILNYRRAEALDSGDADIQKNLAFARGRRIDRVEVPPERRVLRTLFFWHYDFPVRTRYITGCVFFAAACAAAAIMIWVGRQGSPAVTAVIFGLLAAAMFGSVAVEAAVEAGKTGGVIVTAEVIARQGDGVNYPASFKEPLHAGTELDVLEQRPGWLHVRLTDGSKGWIPAGAAELI